MQPQTAAASASSNTLLQDRARVPVQFNSVTPPPSSLPAGAALRCHPATPSRDVRSIAVKLDWRAGPRLELSYVLLGAVASVRLPPAGPRQFADRLWEHTCFEAFVADTQGKYAELNFSPSTQWALYRFDAYRNGMARVEATHPPEIRVNVGRDALQVDVLVDLDYAALAPRGALRLGLCSVVEETDGTLSYWALAHPSPRPDFHHPDGFVLELPRPPATHSRDAQ
jgi:hypothetical protein